MAFHLTSTNKAVDYTLSKDLGERLGFLSFSPVQSSSTPVFLGNSLLSLPDLSPPPAPSPPCPQPCPPTCSKLMSPCANPSQALGAAARGSPKAFLLTSAKGAATPGAVCSLQGSRAALTSSRVRLPRLPLPPRPLLPSSRTARDAVVPGRETAVRTVGFAPCPWTSRARGAPGWTRGSSGRSRSGGGSRTRCQSSS